ncbi:serine/threonine-protein kinase [Murinocardiopsis flavida]|uniref:serine/threonine-protein kinase n=1 Tax=Murinocardiopsis flavida TaxID=645275 RepID=UPI001FE3258D|nr:serine/threonine-protein kinase [Murinocardiopsis flavida]
MPTSSTHGPDDPFSKAGLTPPAPTDPTRIGPYRIAGRLGAGGMGTVFAAIDADGHPAALKMVHREYAADPEFRARFRREVDLIGRVRSHCTPEFRSADTESDRPWLATEYIPGPTLRRHVRAHGPLTDSMLMGLAAGIAEALQAIHRLGIVHRDLKPGNIILAPDGPKVLDFGIARAIEESAITRSGGLFGTAGWLAPEQYQEATVAAEADMFGWGGLVSFSATGRNPFGTGEAAILAFRTMEDPADTEGTPEILLPLVHAALSKDPAQRPTSAEALTEVTRLWTGAEPRTGRPAAATAPTAEAAEAADSLPGLLGTQWTGIPSDDTTATDRSSQWASLARLSAASTHWRHRRIAMTSGAIATALAVGATAWFIGDLGERLGPSAPSATGPPSGQNAPATGSTQGDQGTAKGTPQPQPTRGGANLIGGDPNEKRHLNAVSASTVYSNPHADTIVLTVTTRVGTKDDWRVGPLHNEVTLVLKGAEQSGSTTDLVFDAGYDREVGSFTLHSDDFEVEIADAEEGDGAKVSTHTPSESEVLATLTPEDNEQQIRVPFEGIPSRGAVTWAPDPAELWAFPADDFKADDSYACYSTTDTEFAGQAVDTLRHACTLPENWS